MSTTELETNTEIHEDSQIDSQFMSILSTLSQFKIQITALSNQLKSLEKTVKKEIKQHKKEATKKMSRGNRKPSGFAAASPISDDLCDFMGKDHGTQVARTEVTKFICTYIKEHSLTTNDNNRVIKPDEKLHSLLGTGDEDQVTYFNIQRFMNKHFLNNKNTIKSENK
jgi:chromatin remodeling complex protein RSC6